MKNGQYFVSGKKLYKASELKLDSNVNSDSQDLEAQARQEQDKRIQGDANVQGNSKPVTSSEHSKPVTSDSQEDLEAVARAEQLARITNNSKH